MNRYDIKKDQWERRTPPLRIARSDAASCTLNEFEFVFAGQDSQGKCLNSVEKIYVPYINCPGATWELIKLPEVTFPPRVSPVVVSINKSEILIMGGSGGKF